MHSRKEYRKVLRERYLKARNRKEKSAILDEYCGNTGQNRKYAIRKMQRREGGESGRRKRRRENYDGEVKDALSRAWEVFDYPCGQRLKPLLEAEVDRLRELGELQCSEEAALKLKLMSSATIDRKLKHQREVLHLLRSKGGVRPSSALKQKIAIRLTEWDTREVGYTEVDLVVHCGSSAPGEYLNTVSMTEISSGWWEGEAIMGKTQQWTFQALKRIRGRSPFEWKGIDSDNGTEFISEVLYKYCAREGLELTRSRPNRKNDNAYIEEKNWTHVRKVVGYLRYDTMGEAEILNDLYREKLRLYKNFFQPVMKLVSKERIGGRVKRKYDVPQTPYQRLMESGQISEQQREELERLYLSLNPAELKRRIDARLDELWEVYQQKTRSSEVNPRRRLTPRLVTSSMTQQTPVGLPS